MSSLISVFMSAVIYGWANELTPQHLVNLLMFTSRLGRGGRGGCNMHINEQVTRTATNYNDAFGASHGDGVRVLMLVWITIEVPRQSENGARKALHLFFSLTLCWRESPEHVPFKVRQKGFYQLLCGLTWDSWDQARVLEDLVVMALLPRVLLFL